jgi:uncharacterized protein (UPF0332 family)
MATWSEMSRDSLLTAQRLLAEGHLRSSVSRSYYAARSAISSAFVQRGVSFAHGWNNPSHEQVAALVRNGLALPIDLRRQINQAIRRLRVAREGAGYHPGATVDRLLAAACIHDASRVIRALESTND